MATADDGQWAFTVLSKEGIPQSVMAFPVASDYVIKSELVEHGVIEPIGQARSDWRFASVSIVRVAMAKRLCRNLELSPSGLALVLELLDQIDELCFRPGSSATTDRMEE